MLVKDDDDFLVKVIDFGLAKSIKHTDDEDLATLSMEVLSAQRTSPVPSSSRKRKSMCAPTFYSLGVTLWYMLAGQVPLVARSRK